MENPTGLSLTLLKKIRDDILRTSTFTKVKCGVLTIADMDRMFPPTSSSQPTMKGNNMNTAIQDTSKFVQDLTRFNHMYAMPVSDVPTLNVGVPLTKRLTDLKIILQKELNEIDSIVEKAGWYEKGISYVVDANGCIMPETPLIDSDSEARARLEINRLDILTDIADLMGDFQVYCGSEMKKFGIPQDPVLVIIMDSNFSKMGADGKPIYDENGKLQKGPGYWKPEPRITQLLASYPSDGQNMLASSTV
jgi:hypothetical protein